MLLQRRLIVLLEKYRIKYNLNPSREFFIEIISKKKWPRWNYFYLNRQAFSRKIDGVFGDCIRGKDPYVAEDESGDKLFVTTRGREFIKKTKLPEELLKRYNRTSQFFKGSLFGAMAPTTAWLIKHYWPWISSQLGL